jgi:hypothetical protein
MIKVTESEATPQMSEPISRTKIASRYDQFAENRRKTRPKTGWKAHAVSRYEEPYQPMSLVDENSLVM